MPLADPTVFTAESHLNNILSARIVGDISNVVSKYDANTNRLLKILTKAKGKDAPCVSTHIRNWENVPLPRYNATSGTVATTGTAITVTNGEFYREDDLVQMPSVNNEIMSVTSVDGDVVSVIRDFTGDQTGDNTIPDGTSLFIMSGARSEMSNVRDIITTQLQPKDIYTQVFENTFGISLIADKEKLYATDGRVGSEFRRLQKDAMSEFLLDQEYSALFGSPFQYSSGTHKSWVAAGLLYFTYLQDTANANYQSVTGTLTEATWDEFLQKVYRYGSGNKLLVCGGRLIRDLESIAKGKMQVWNGDTKYALNLQSYRNGFGLLKILYHPLLDAPVTDHRWGRLGFIVDIGFMRRRHLRDFKQVYAKHVETPGLKARVDTFISIATLELQNQLTHGLIEYTAAAE